MFSEEKKKSFLLFDDQRNNKQGYSRSWIHPSDLDEVIKVVQHYNMGDDHNRGKYQTKWKGSYRRV